MYTRILYLIIFLPFFADQANGFLRYEMGITSPISQITKIALLFGMIFYLMLSAYSSKKYMVAFFIFITSSLIGTIHSFYTKYGDASNLIGDLGYALKVFTMPLAYFFFASYFKRIRDVDAVLMLERVYSKVYSWQFYLVVGACVLGYFGFGIPFYEHIEGGTQGYFIAGNELSAYYLLVVSIVLFYAIRQNFQRSLLVLGVSLIGAVLIGSKSVIAGVFLLAGGNYLFYKKYYGRVFTFTKLDRNVMVSVGAILLLAAVFFNQILAVVDPLIRLMSYKLKIYDSVYAAVLAGRNFRIDYILTHYLPEKPFIELLFGEGYTFNLRNIIPNPEGQATKFVITESDPIDMLVIFGFFGAICLYGAYMYAFRKIYRMYKQRLTPLAVPAMLAILLLITLSFVSGHVIYASLMNLNLGFMIAFVARHGQLSLEEQQNQVVGHNS